VVHSHTDRGRVRRAEIVATAVDGEPPFRVRWVGDNHQSVVFPGPDAQIIPGAG
jgi:hypothetical protein